MKEVPVVVKEYSENEIFTIALIENIQREDLKLQDLASLLPSIAMPLSVSFVLTFLQSYMFIFFDLNNTSFKN